MRSLLKCRISLTLCILTAVVITAAGTAPGKEPEKKDKGPTAETLRKAPTTVAIDGKTLQIKATIIRNAMPTIGGPRGPRIYMIVRLSAKGGGPLPKGLTYETVFSVQDDKVWQAQKLEKRPSRGGITMQLVARKAPGWSGKAAVDVILKLRDGEKKEHLIRAPGVRPMTVH